MTPAALSVRDLRHRYGTADALRGVSFDLAPGECVGLVGPNGAGKSTLLMCLCGVLAAPPGAVRVAGLDPADPAQRRRLPEHVGVVFADSDDQLFNPTVAEDVAFGPVNLGLPADEVTARVAEALAAVGLAGSGAKVPYRMSSGEKRRAALAGVLAMRPGLILFDEPSTFLDPRGRRELIAVVRSLAATRLVATHDLDLVLEACGRVIVLDGGAVVADGPAAELLADAALMGRHGLEVPGRLAGRTTPP